MPPPSKELRRRVEARAGWCCEYCRSQLRFSNQPFAIDHVIPLARGGKSGLENLALSCQGCNNHKYTKIEERDPTSGAMTPLFNPRIDGWSQHFSWSPDATLIIGLSPCGRATVEALHLNRGGVVAFRKVLYEAGEHPPAEPSPDGWE